MIRWNLGMLNRRRLPETNAVEWLIWQKLVSTFIMLLHIHKTIAYRIKNRFVQRKFAGDGPRSGSQKKLAPLKERYIQITSRLERFLTANSLCKTAIKILTCCPFKNILWKALCTIRMKQNRSTKGCSRLKRSVDMTSSGKNGLNIRTNASPKWDRTRCPEE